MKKLIFLSLFFNQVLAQNPILISGPTHGLGQTGDAHPDGLGGYIYTIHKPTPNESIPYKDVYIQRKDALGNKLFGEDGIKLADKVGLDNGTQSRIIVADGNNGEKKYYVFFGSRGPNNSIMPYLYEATISSSGTILSNTKIIAQKVVASYSLLPDKNRELIYIGFQEAEAVNNIPVGRGKLQIYNTTTESAFYPHNGLFVDILNCSSGAPTISFTDNNQVNLSWGTGLQRLNSNTNLLDWMIPKDVYGIGSRNYFVQSRSVSGHNPETNEYYSDNGDIVLQVMKSDTTLTYPDNGWTSQRFKGHIFKIPGAQTVRGIISNQDAGFVLYDSVNNVTFNNSPYFLVKVLPNGTLPWGEKGKKIGSGNVATSSVFLENDKITVVGVAQSGYNQFNINIQSFDLNGRPLLGSDGYIFSLNNTILANYKQGEDEGIIVNYSESYSDKYAIKLQPCLNPPLKPSVNQPKLSCSSGTATFKATGCTGTVNWYAADLITKVHTGPNYSISANQEVSYFAECVDNTTNCASLELAESKLTILNSTPVNITQTYTPSNTPVNIENSTKITANNKIEPNARVSYKSSNIELKDGFHVKEGAIFQASVSSCTSQD
jgi:hypothetical protein